MMGEQPDWLNAATCIENMQIAYDDATEADPFDNGNPIPIDTVVDAGDLGVLIGLARHAVATRAASPAPATGTSGEDVERLLSGLRSEACRNGGHGSYAWRSRELCGKAADVIEALTASPSIAEGPSIPVAPYSDGELLAAADNLDHAEAWLAARQIAGDKDRNAGYHSLSAAVGAMMLRAFINFPERGERSDVDSSLARDGCNSRPLHQTEGIARATPPEEQPVQGEVERLREALADLIDHADSLPKKTPAAGTCVTEHQFKIEAGTIWGLDLSVQRARAALSTPCATVETGEGM